MKKTKILVPAMAVLALGMAAAVTGTVAWFSSNTQVSASNMTISATTSKSLMISLDNAAWSTAVEMDSTAARRQSVSPVTPVDTAETVTSSVSIEHASHAPYTIVNTLDFYHNNLTANPVPNPAESTATHPIQDAITAGKIGASGDTNYYLLDDGTNYDVDDLYLLYTDQAGKVSNINMTCVVTIANKNVEIWKALHIGVLVCGDGNDTAGTVTAGDKFYDYDLGSIIPVAGEGTTATATITANNFFTMAAAANKHMITYAWFEGEDEDCKSLNSMSAVTDSIVFNFALGSEVNQG